MPEEKLPFWERPEVVERFAGRAPDHRLSAWLSERDSAEALCVLDIGCAGGRNAEHLARVGCDLQAIDASAPMVRRTRLRVAGVLGEREAARRVRLGRMENLGGYGDEAFDLIVALGVYHGAPDRQTYERAIAETARVLAQGGTLLVSNFAPGTELDGVRLEPLAEEPGVYVGHDAGRHYLLDAGELDQLLADHGLYPEIPTATVVAEGESFRRITVNGQYRKG